MPKRKLLSTVLLIILLATHSAQAGQDVWTTIGPEGHSQPTTLRGDPTEPGTLFLGTDGAGIFQSNNGGMSWQPARSGLPDTRVNVIFVDPVHADILYAAVGSSIRLFKSTDGGVSWNPAGTGLPASFVRAMAVDPVTSTTLYATTAQTSNGGVFKSLDGGMSWNLMSAGLPSRSDDTGQGAGAAVHTLVIDPDTPQTIYVAVTPEGEESAAVYKSTDGAASWQPVGAGLELAAGGPALTIDPTDPRTLYAGSPSANDPVAIFKSTDGGATWSRTSGEVSGVPVSALLVNPQESQTVHAQTDRGIYVTFDGGDSWHFTNTGLPQTIAGTLTRDSLDPDTLYVATRGAAAVYRSVNGGANWAPTTDSGLTNITLDSLILDPDGQTLYAGASSRGVLKSTDGGARWNPASNGFPANPNAIALAIGSADRQTLYSSITSLSGFGLYKSTNAGSSWMVVSNEVFVRTFASHGTDPATVYVGTGNGVLKITDASTEPMPVSVGLPEAADVRALAIAPTDARLLYAGMQQGVFKSTNGAETWDPTEEGLPEVRSLLIDPADPQIVYAGTNGQGGLFKTVDGGAQWDVAVTTQENPLQFSQVIALTRHAVTGTLYAGTFNNGVYRSTDGGASWTPFNEGLFNTRVRALVSDPVQATRLYAATGGAGVFVIDDCGATGEDCPVCLGDCNESGGVTVDELLRGTGIVLGELTVDDCAHFDPDRNGIVDIVDLVLGLRNVIAGCTASAVGNAVP